MNAAAMLRYGWMIHDVTHFFSRDGAEERRFVVLMFDVGAESVTNYVSIFRLI